MTGKVLKFRAMLLDWYGRNARDLPWRHMRDPYAVWVSEIMLQQTRVAAVMDYYAYFLREFPTMEALAEAEEESVLAQWSGLGYYRRARMMHKTARIVMAEHGGQLPRTAATLRELPGIGEYTAAAVASICHDEAVPVVDGNVERVLLRMYGPRLTETDGGSGNAAGEKTNRKAGMAVFRATARRLLDPKRPGDFNQAMMELGATVCLPKAPLCGACPVWAHCRTQGEHKTGPARQMRSRKVGYALVRKNLGWKTEILLRRRGEDESQMPGMWELPAEPEDGLPEDMALLTMRHSITNTNYYVTIYALGSDERQLLKAPRGTLQWTKRRELDGLPLTGLTRKVLKRVKIFPVRAGTAWR